MGQPWVVDDGENGGLGVQWWGSLWEWNFWALVCRWG